MDLSELLETAEAWRRADPDPGTAAELAALIERRDERELTDRFAGKLEFGTAGLRGILGAGPNRMNRAVVRRTTLGLGRYLLREVPDVRSRGVVVGRDGRRLSDELASDTAGVLAALGIPALVFTQVVPTPVCAFAVRFLNAAAAVTITASHNPPEYNGYKVFWQNGAQIIPPHDTGIAEEIDRAGDARDIAMLAPDNARAAGLWRDLGAEVEGAYIDGVLALGGRPEADLVIVYTALHGVGGRFVSEVFERAGYKRFHPVAAQHAPDGSFPTVRFPNPEEPGSLDLSARLAAEVAADVVLANDPDADRLAAMVRDRNGQLAALSGNEVGVLLAHYLLSRSKGKKPLVLTTIVSSPQLGAIARDLGVLYEETLTGFKWLANRALELEAEQAAELVFAYEEALGYSVRTLVRDKDGIGAARVFADLCAWCKARGTTARGYLEEIQRQHGLYVAAQRNFTSPGTEGALKIRAIMDGFRQDHPTKVGDVAVVAVKDYEEGVGALPKANVIAYELAGGSRVTLRPSGTEPKLKYYFDLRENALDDEPLGSAHVRADRKLTELISDFLTVAKQRGQ